MYFTSACFPSSNKSFKLTNKTLDFLEATCSKPCSCPVLQQTTLTPPQTDKLNERMGANHRAGMDVVSPNSLEKTAFNCHKIHSSTLNSFGFQLTKPKIIWKFWETYYDLVEPLISFIETSHMKHSVWLEMAVF